VGNEDEKRLAAEAAALLVEAGMAVGLGTGTTVAHFLPALAARRLDIICVATSQQTEVAARALGLPLEGFGERDRLDIAVDGADQIAPDAWLVKGGGGAHAREKIVAAASDRFVVIASSHKRVTRIAAPVPLELDPFGLHATIRLVGDVELRNEPPTLDGGILADYVGPVGEPGELSARLDAVPGVAAHGLFSPELVTEILVGVGDRVERRRP
jgi:ribose 5-phosphate isomerase A